LILKRRTFMSIMYPGLLLAFVSTFARVKDHYGRVFVLGRNAEVTMDVKHGGWKPVLPVVEDAILHLAEADALRREGNLEEAVCLLRAIEVMGTGPSKDATRRLENIDRSRAVKDLLAQCDPIVYFRKQTGRTTVQSDTAGLKVSFLGEFRIMKAKSVDSPTLTQKIIYLGHDAESILIAYDLWPRSVSVEDYRRIWDKRRGITSTSTLSDLNAGICWPGRIEAGGPTTAQCAIYEMVEGKQGIEYYETGRLKGIFLAFSGKDRARDALRELRITK
ncbi:MAG TPA: hypothetical protein PLW55_10950, partial [Leptospiraceae bacterium]|nr:hypothetical protein [Leptospiraceae bacterium]